MLPADRRRRVAWGANAPSLSTVIAAAAMMNGAAHRRLNSQIAFPQRTENFRFRAPLVAAGEKEARGRLVRGQPEQRARRGDGGHEIHEGRKAWVKRGGRGARKMDGAARRARGTAWKRRRGEVVVEFQDADVVRSELPVRVARDAQPRGFAVREAHALVIEKGSHSFITPLGGASDFENN